MAQHGTMDLAELSLLVLLSSHPVRCPHPTPECLLLDFSTARRFACMEHQWAFAGLVVIFTNSACQQWASTYCSGLHPKAPILSFIISTDVLMPKGMHCILCWWMIKQPAQSKVLLVGCPNTNGSFHLYSTCLWVAYVQGVERKILKRKKIQHVALLPDSPLLPPPCPGSSCIPMQECIHSTNSLPPPTPVPIANSLFLQMVSLHATTSNCAGRLIASVGKCNIIVQHTPGSRHFDLRPDAPTSRCNLSPNGTISPILCRLLGLPM